MHLPFLHRLANALLEQHGNALERVAVVLPSRRAGIYLRRYLAQAAGRSIWSPEMLDMGAFLERLTGIRQGRTLELLFLLHEAHVVVEGERARPMAEFMQWAPVTLRDMSEVDAHLLDLADLYRDLRSFHEIEDWSMRLGEPSAGQVRLMQQWLSTGALHRTMNEVMGRNGVGTSGSIARHAAGSATAGTLQPPWEAIWFAGLNALDPATTAIVQRLQRDGKAFVAWDADPYYLKDHEQESGYFMRRSIAALGEGRIQPEELLRTLPRTVHSVSVPNPVAQARYAAQYLSELDADERRRTAVVLADEDLLMPFLEALPEDLGPMNITMGVPLSSLPVHGLTEAFLDLHLRVRTDGHDLHALERLFMHPFLHQGAVTGALIAHLRGTQRYRIDPGRIREALGAANVGAADDLMEAITPLDELTAAAIPKRFDALLSHARRIRTTDAFVQEQLYRMAKLQRRLHLALARAGAPDVDLHSYTALRARLVREERITFFGEPLSGLQVMGFLEARAIDHDRVLILGANEGTLPRSAAQQSWIPFAIRRAYKLPLGADTDAITAYHFHRLAQRTADLHLVHDAEGADAGGPSRYIAQWKRELIGRSATELKGSALTARAPVRKRPGIAVAKDAAVVERIDAMRARGISPSALGTWLTCPLDFHFKYVLRIEEAEEMDGKLGSDVLGEAVHAVLEEQYKPFIGQRIEEEALRAAAGGTHDAIRTHLAKSYPNTTLSHGHFKLRIEMAAKAVADHLLAEARRVAGNPTELLHLEQEVVAKTPAGTHFKGRCDRVEVRDGVVHILDLKTGGVQARDLVLGKVEREAIGPQQRYALQLMIYAWCFLQQNPSVERVRAGIIPLQRVSQSEGLLLELEGSTDITRNMTASIGALLDDLIAELMDTATPFTHDPDSRYCGLCVP